jgi:hypothetical protein
MYLLRILDFRPHNDLAANQVQLTFAVKSLVKKD